MLVSVPKVRGLKPRRWWGWVLLQAGEDLSHPRLSRGSGRCPALGGPRRAGLSPQSLPPPSHPVASLSESMCAFPSSSADTSHRVRGHPRPVSPPSNVVTSAKILSSTGTCSQLRGQPTEHQWVLLTALLPARQNPQTRNQRAS